MSNKPVPQTKVVPPSVVKEQEKADLAFLEKEVAKQESKAVDTTKDRPKRVYQFGEGSEPDYPIDTISGGNAGGE